MGRGSWRLRRRRVFDHAKSELVVGTLKGQRHVVEPGGGAVLDGEREIVGLSLEVKVEIAPSMKLGASAQRLASAKVVRGFSSVVYDDDGEVKQALELS